MQDTMPKILPLSHSNGNISEDKTDSLPSVHDPPTSPVLGHYLVTGD